MGAGEVGAKSMGTKAVKALGIVVVLLAAVWLVGRAVEGEPSASSDGGSLEVAMVQGRDQELSDALSFAKELGFYGSVNLYEPGESDAQLTAGFTQELLSVDSYSAVLVAEGRNLVGFASNLAASALYEQCLEELTAKGWVAVPSGQENQCSLVKETGEYTWAYLVCADSSEGSMGALSFQTEQLEDRG